MALGVAHEIASALEEAVRDEIGPEVEVETHIEPLQASGEAGIDAAPERRCRGARCPHADGRRRHPVGRRGA